MSPPIVSREEAREKGLKLFFTGTACRRGHICERYTSAYTCIECSKLPQRKAAVKAYDVEHEITRKAYINDWRQKNKKRRYLLNCRWAKQNPLKHALVARRRRLRLRKAVGSHTYEQILDLLKKQHSRCASCLISIGQKFEVDHIVAVSKGGSDDISNIQLLCVSCNRKKNAKDPLVWARENGRLL